MKPAQILNTCKWITNQTFLPFPQKNFSTLKKKKKEKGKKKKKEKGKIVLQTFLRIIFHNRYVSVSTLKVDKLYQQKRYKFYR